MYSDAAVSSPLHLWAMPGTSESPYQHLSHVQEARQVDDINTESHLQCGLFLPGTCAATCPMAGLFCVGSILLSIYIINM